MEMNKTIVWIGAGNLATQMALEMHRNGLSIQQVYSRTAESAKALAQQLQTASCTSLQEVIDADIYIFALKDTALEEVIAQMPHRKGIWIHTSGSMPMDVFKGNVEHYGVLYPLQTFSKNKKVDWSTIPLFIEASDESTLMTIQELAHTFHSSYQVLSSEERKYIHLAAVFACNFSNHMFALATDILQKANVSFDILKPLIKETIQKLDTLSPLEAQTGPAVRYDTNVIDKHLNLLKEQPELQNIYERMSKSIHQTHLKKKKHE